MSEKPTVDGPGPLVILVGPSHAGNIGACARAMKNMGLTRLRLVAPVAGTFPHPEATARASGAADVLSEAPVFDTLEGALAEVHWAIGTSARPREMGPPVQAPREAAAEAAQRERGGERVALVFGREKSGLSNEELEACHGVVHIPAASGYASLNLAQAVQIMAYELFLARSQEPPVARGTQAPATGGSLQNLIRHWERVVADVGFVNPQSPQRTFRRLRRLLWRARPTDGEVRLLRGFLSAVEKRIHGPVARNRPQGRRGKGRHSGPS